jgi:hypothetical protein
MATFRQSLHAGFHVLCSSCALAVPYAVFAMSRGTILPLTRHKLPMFVGPVLLNRIRSGTGQVHGLRL